MRGCAFGHRALYFFTANTPSPLNSVANPQRCTRLSASVSDAVNVQNDENDQTAKCALQRELDLGHRGSSTFSSTRVSGAKIVLFDGSPAFPSLDRLWKLAEEEKISNGVIVVINRLGDYLFTAARYANKVLQSDESEVVIPRKE